VGWTQLLAWGAFWIVAMMATSNAVNLADGLDGLAAGICALSSAGFAVLALLSERHLVAVAALALTGACLGFLWFNRHPAKVFMGDVGSLALGTALAAMAALMDAPLALIALCLVAFIEELSVIIQVVSYQTRGVRVFKMSPIHHHFELCGWPERKVVLVFWAVQLLAAAVIVGWEAAGRAL
jgi:phospho-N-acetylmuramoyl-pentapeptide-transferase